MFIHGIIEFWVHTLECSRFFYLFSFDRQIIGWELVLVRLFTTFERLTSKSMMYFNRI